jgi:NAD(P)-dependent dehydrogenase (short-subunit alcohol dehydrogenase family)
MERRKVLITGAASGIGKATAIRFANEGYDVFLNDIQEEKLREVLNELADGNHLSICGSYAEKDVIHNAEIIIQQSWGTLDALINCAGIFERTDPIKMDIDHWRVFLHVERMLLVSHCSKFMTTGGRIVHIFHSGTG